MTTHDATPAGWYEDPAKVGELRYHDGSQWTEHVTIDGVQTTAPFDAPAPAFTMSRLAQWRSEGEKPVEVVGAFGVLGRFVTLLDGTPGYRFEDPAGGTVLTLSKPSLKTAIELTDPAGYPVGTITKVGRLHSRYDISRVEGEPATVKLAGGSVDAWEVHVAGKPVATITRMSSSPPDALNLAAVEYSTHFSGELDDDVQRLLLVIPMAIDILDTQAL